LWPFCAEAIVEAFIGEKADGEAALSSNSDSFYFIKALMGELNSFSVVDAAFLAVFGLFIFFYLLEAIDFFGESSLKGDL
jgi:hypothetical protein